MVGVARIELATPAMSTQCSTTELHAHEDARLSRAGQDAQAPVGDFGRLRAPSQPGGAAHLEQPINLQHQVAQMKGF